MAFYKIFIGCAGWSIPGAYRELFPGEGNHLQRYARRFNAVEINSSFYRHHRRETYTRWAESTPETFRFAVKMPRQLTHLSRLCDRAELTQFLSEVNALGDKLGPLLMQLPPGFSFDPELVKRFCTLLREGFQGEAVCEPRHGSWFTSGAGQLLAEFRIARAAADPPVVPPAEFPGGWKGLFYFRFHGSPRMYYSKYPPERLEAIARSLREAAREAPVWCIFNNTAGGAAPGNGLDLLQMISLSTSST